MSIFTKLFGGRDERDDSSYREGQQIFAEGMKAAGEYRTSEAIALYTKSFEVSPNPSPLINRAKLYRWRLLFAEAIRDLEIAMSLDRRQGNQFSAAIARELQECKAIAQTRFSGKRDLFVTDLKAKGHDYVAGRVADTVFEGDGELLGYHMINEVDDIKKFENITDFPSVKTLLTNWMDDQSIIDEALADQDIGRTYRQKRPIFEAMICVYDYPDMAKLRDAIVRKSWCLLNPPVQRQALWEYGLRNPDV